MPALIVREWHGCEDCMATGGRDGSCGTCGGRGRLPTNQAARDEVERETVARQAAVWDRIWAEDGEGEAPLRRTPVEWEEAYPAEGDEASHAS